MAEHDKDDTSRPAWPGPNAAGISRFDWINGILQRAETLYRGESSPLEAAHGSYRARSVHWIARLHGSFAAVARILKDGEHVGSGCAVRSSALGFSFDEIVVVTAGHVVCDPDLPGATPDLVDRQPELMEVCFDERMPSQTYACEVIWQSPVSQLDVCVLRLKPLSDYLPLYHFEVPVLPVATREPAETFSLPRGGRRNQRLVVLAHAAGADASATLEDNSFVGYSTRAGTSFPTFLHYNCPTAPGASGAAVLNEALELVAIHRAGAATLADGATRDPAKPNRNEGVSIQSLRVAITRWRAATEIPRRQPFWSRFRWTPVTSG